MSSLQSVLQTEVTEFAALMTRSSPLALFFLCKKKRGVTERVTREEKLLHHCSGPTKGHRFQADNTSSCRPRAWCELVI